MFGGTSTVAVDDSPFAYADSGVALKALQVFARRRNTADAHLVLTAAAMFELAWEDDVDRLGETAVERCGEAAVMEMSIALGVSPTSARKLVGIGTMMTSKLPLVRAAFRAGDLDLARVRTICDGLDAVSDTTIAAVERTVVDAALQRAPRALAAEITRLLIDTDAAEAARIRRGRQRNGRSVSVTADRDGMSKLLAMLTAEEATAVTARIDEMVATVCKDDPRSSGAVRTDAFVALIHCEQYLVCGCQRETCPTRHLARPDRPGIEIHVHVDVETLLGRADRPATMEGYGPIDPALARELAHDAATVVAEDASYRIGAQGLGGVVADVLAAIDQDPDLLNGEFPGGHGDLDVPPTGALTYRPRKKVRERVFGKYATCTFPNCPVPVRKCQWDHLEPFDHEYPERGGWTIESNGHPVCPRHHQVKTDGNFCVVRLANDVIAWKSRNGVVGITIPDELTGYRDTQPSPRPPRWDTAPIEPLPPDDPIYQPTWWEEHMQPADTPPTLEQLAYITDLHHRQQCMQLRGQYDQHTAILDQRERHAPAPF